MNGQQDSMSEDKVKPSETAKTEQDDLLKWQEKVLPTMRAMLIGLTIFFFIPSLIQLGYLHQSIFEGSKIDKFELPDLLSTSTDKTYQETLTAGHVQSMIALESYVLERRYHQANVILMTSAWIRYLGFATGMILSLIGASFILGKMQEASSRVEGDSPLWRLSLQSSSPGIIMVALGVMLMATTIVGRHEIKVTDRPVYTSFNGTVPGVMEELPEITPLPLPPTPEELDRVAEE